MNENLIRVYDSVAGTLINDPDHLLDRAQDIQFSTVYPGGIFDTASFFIPCDPTRYRPIKHVDRLQIKNGLTTVWEGYITSITLVVTPERTGLDVQATGAWGFAFKRYKYNRWIDRRYESDIYGVWTLLTTGTGAQEKLTVDQTDQIKLKPEPIQWGNGETAYISYNTNASSNVKRVKFSYVLGAVAETLPVRAKKFTQIGGTYTSNLSNMIDGNAASSQTVSLASNDLLYVGLPIDQAAGITGFRFDFGATVNAVAASTLTLEYFTNGHTWQSITITDNTSNGGICWARDGTVTFTEIDGLHWIDVNGSQEFVYFRFGANKALTANIVIVDIYIQRTQSWTLFLNDLTNSTTLWSTSTPGSGTQDITLAPTAAQIAFGLTSIYSQTPIGDGIYGRITDLALVAESWDGNANTTVSTIMQNMVHHLGSPFKDDYTYIVANTYDLLSTGFVSDDLKTSLGDDMRFIGSFSATDEPYSVGALESDAVSGANTDAVVYYEKVPALTDYDYAIRLDEQTVSGVELVLSADLDTLFNQAYVVFTTINGKTQWANYSDYASLIDSTSATKYKSRLLIVQGGEAATPALAGPFGATYIKAKKDLAYYMRAPLQLTGTIRRKDGSLVPVSHVRAGKRIKIENFATDVGDTVNAGLTFLITGTSYDDASGILTVTANISDDLGLQIARINSGTSEAGIKTTRG